MTKKTLVEELQAKGRGLRKFQEEAVINALKGIDAQYGIGMPAKVIEHTAEIVPQSIDWPAIGDEASARFPLTLGALSGRMNTKDPEPQRLPPRVGLGNGKSRPLGVAVISGDNYRAQALAAAMSMGDLIRRYQNAGATIIMDEVHFNDGRPPEFTDWIGIDYASIEARVEAYSSKPITGDELRSMMRGLEAKPETPYRHLSYEEMQRLSRQRIPTSGVNHSVYLRSFEPAGPAIVGKPTKHRAKAIAGRKAKRKNRK